MTITKNHAIIAVAVLALVVVFFGSKTTNLNEPPTSSLSWAEASDAANDICSKRKNLFYTPVYGNSMKPAIYGGNTIVIYESIIDTAKIKKGDYVLRQTGVGKTLHRCISVNKEKGTIKITGVNNMKIDMTVDASDLIGRYVMQIVFDPEKGFAWEMNKKSGQ